MECGAKLDAGESTVTTPEETKKQVKPKKPKMILAIVGILVVIVLAAVIVPRVTGVGSSEKKVVKAYFEGIINQDSEKIIDLFPKELLKAAEKEDSGSVKGMQSDIQDSLDEVKKAWDDEYGDGWKISYKINNIQELSQTAVESLNDRYSEIFEDNISDMSKLKITEAKNAEVELMMYVGKDKKESETIEINLIKTGNKWCLDVLDMEDLLFY